MALKKNNKKKVLIINSILLVSLIVGTVFSWFAVNYNNKINSKEVEVIADGALELSLDGSNWQSSINLSNDTAWFKKTKFTDITGSGNGDFYRPSLTQNENTAEVNTAGNLTFVENFPKSKDNDGEYDYAKFTVYMRSTEELKISLGAIDNVASGVYSIDALSGDGVLNLAGVAKDISSDSTTKFSKDLVAGAIRISAVILTDNSDNTVNREHKFTWIPRPEIYVDNYTTFSDANINLNSQNGESYKHYYLNQEKIKTELEENVKTGKLADNKAELLTLTKNNIEDRYYTGKVEFNIWLEGCDNEARRAFVQGQFKVLLNIISEQTSTN